MEEMIDPSILGSMKPSRVNLIAEDGSRQEVTRFPLRDEFIVDPVTGETVASRMHHGEDFQPVTE